MRLTILVQMASKAARNPKIMARIQMRVSKISIQKRE